MYCRLQWSIVYALVSLVVSILICSSCYETASPLASPGDDPFFKEKNDLYNGDYIATYPLSNPDSCILRLKAEVPEHLQPWGCLALWYHLPRTSPKVSFRLLELYDQYYPHDTVFAFTQMMRGEFLVELNQHDSARILLSDARNQYLRLHRLLDASDADYLMARCYQQEHNTAKALEQYFQVMDLLNRNDTTFSHRHICLYMDIASAYMQTKDYTKELLWLKKAWNSDFSKLTEPWNYQIRFAKRLSTNYAKTNNADSSLIMARLALNIFRTHSQKPLPAELLYRIGFAYLEKETCDSALTFLLHAARSPINSPNSFMKNQIVQSIGESYLCLGKLDSATFFFHRALATPDTGNLAGALRSLATIHARQNHFKAAYEAEKESHTLFRRLFALEKATALSEFEARYESTQKERRIAELKAEQKITRQQSLLIGLSLLLLSGSLFALFLQQRNRRRNLEQATQLLEKDKTLLEQEKQLSNAREQLQIQALQRSQAALEQTENELSSTNRLLTLKNQLIKELELRNTRQHITPVKADPTHSDAKDKLRNMKILNDEDWMSFLRRFDEQLPGFLKNLKTKYPTLSSAETRLFLLIKLDIETLDIAKALGISKESVWRSRHRLCKKLNLPETSDLDLFVHQF